MAARNGRELPGHEPLMTGAEVAALFRVSQATVSRWVLEGRISSIKTPGRHNRFRKSEVHAFLAATPQARQS